MSDNHSAARRSTILNNPPGSLDLLRSECLNGRFSKTVENEKVRETAQVLDPAIVVVPGSWTNISTWPLDS